MDKLFRDIFLFSIGITFFNIINTNAQMKVNAISNTAKNKSIKVLELRNYLLKPGKRDNFINFFEANFIKSQNALGGYIIGQFRVKGAPDNFFWLRGFEDMDSRSKYLPEFYQSEFWKERRTIANDLINNNDNVYLLKPLTLPGEDKDTAINSSDIGKLAGITVIDFYIANDKLDELILFFRNKYVPFLRGLGILYFTMWRSETQVNDFPSLPVFQDKNLLVTISHFKNENEYLAKRKQINSLTHHQMKISLNEVVTTKTTIILFPTDNSWLQ